MAKRIIGKKVRGQGALISHAQVARLRGLGLVKKGQGKTAKSRIALRKKYKDVLAGRATAVKVPKAEAKRFRKKFQTKENIVIVPRQKGERVSVDKSGRITTTRMVAGQRVRRIIYAGGKMPKPRPGKKFMYAVPFANGGRVRFDSMQALAEFMSPYEQKTFGNWREYVEIEEVDADEDDGAEE